MTDLWIKSAQNDSIKADIPRSWDEVRVGQIGKIKNGLPFDSEYFGSEGLPLIRIRDLFATEVATRYSGPSLTEDRITRDDVLVGMDGDFNVSRWKVGEPGLLNQRVLALRADRLTSRWIEYCIRFPLKIINDLTYSTTVKHLSSNQVAKIRIPLPPGASCETL